MCLPSLTQSLVVLGTPQCRLWLYYITCTEPGMCAVRCVVVHLIVVCWVLLLQSSGAEQIGQTRWPTELFALACVEINSKSTFGAEQIGHTRWPTEIFAHACVELVFRS